MGFYKYGYELSDSVHDRKCLMQLTVYEYYRYSVMTSWSSLVYVLRPSEEFLRTVTATL